MNDMKKTIDISDEMAEAGAEIIFSEPGIAPCGISFSGSELARKVYLAMVRVRMAQRGTK